MSATRFAQAARAGIAVSRGKYPKGSTVELLQARVRTAGQNIKAALDAIVADKMLTPKERSDRTKRALADHAGTVQQLQSEGKALRAHRDRIAAHIAAKVEEFEARATPLAIKRAELESKRLQDAGGRAVVDAWERAQKTSDTSLLAALSMLPGGAARALQLLGAIVEPEPAKTLATLDEAIGDVDAGADALAIGHAELVTMADRGEDALAVHPAEGVRWAAARGTLATELGFKRQHQPAVEPQGAA